MLALPYLVASFLFGLLLVQRLFPDTPPLVRLAGGYLTGLLLTAWATFLLAFALSSLDDALTIAIWLVLAAEIVVLALWGRRLSPSALKLSPLEMAVVGLALLFSFWLMDQRLSGEPPSVSLNTWGDFGLHIPLARSFTWAHNFPPEYPFFAGEPIRYHFGFDFYAGVLEELGLPVVYAFNIPGALGFAAMMLLVFELGRLLFRRVSVAVMAVVLLITNGSLSFLRYFDLYNNDVPEAVSKLWDHNRYLAVGPYLVEGKIDQIAIYWTLNAFLTQTHTIIAIAIGLFIAYGLLQPLRKQEPLGHRRLLALGALLGLAFWLSAPVFVAVFVFCVALLLVFGRWRELVAFLVPVGLLALPQAVWLNGGLSTGGSIRQHTGYLVCSSPDASCNADGFRFDELDSYWDFAQYWWLNLGLAFPLMVLAAVWAGKEDRRLMLAAMAIFLFGNFVQLGRDLGGHNHKVFNTWEILMNLFVAFAFVKLWDLRVRQVDMSLVGRAAIPAVFLFLVLSGIIDFMVIKNDPRFTVFGNREAEIEWIRDNTRHDAVFLVSPDLYATPSLAGRRLFLGYVPWAGGAGYDVAPREKTVRDIYGAASKVEACRLLTAHGIDFVQVGPGEANNRGLQLNDGLFARDFVVAFNTQASDGPIALYDVEKSCP